MAKNSFFKFKQFTVRQDQCTMKVCTDACVLGAWADVKGCERILDIGTGTGLLSLMIAQRDRNVKIDAIEIDQLAFEQAEQNVKESPFQSRIELTRTAVQDYDPGYQYDSVVSNPPFFQSDLRSPRKSKNVAHHAESLSFEELLFALDRLISPAGSFTVLLPMEESIVFSSKAVDLNWYVERNLVLYHHSGKKPFRRLTRFCRTEVFENGQITEDLYIYEPDGKSYHPRFRELMKDYYLIF
jgi:tRNA1Val (adenine37-N6)-methyltransferase